MVFGSREGVERLPRTSIPEDLTCRLCEVPVTCKNVAGYQGHMAGRHSVFFEIAPPRDDNARFNALKEREPKAFEDPAELPAWAKLAIIRHEIFGESYADCAESMGKSPQTLATYGKTPAAAKAREQIGEITDIKNLTKLLIESATNDMYMDWLVALKWAKDNRDYKQVHLMMKDIGLQPVLQDAKAMSNKPTTLILNMSAKDLESIETVTSYTIQEAVIEDDDDADGGD